MDVILIAKLNQVGRVWMEIWIAQTKCRKFVGMPLEFRQTLVSATTVTKNLEMDAVSSVTLSLVGNVQEDHLQLLIYVLRYVEMA